MDIYDIHCHIMYGVDDGSKSEDMTFKMLDIAYEEGIRGIILTPHYNPRAWKVEKSFIRERYEEIKAKALEIHPDMKIYLGNEVYYRQSVEAELDNIQNMADSRYILVEFDISVSFKQICQAVNEMIQNERIPIIAHVERYECLLKDEDLIYDLMDRGAYIQVNAKSVVGDNGRPAKKFAKKLLKNRWVHFIATDAHRDEGRAPYIASCVSYVAKKYGEDYANSIFTNNPLAIINDEYIEE